MLSQQGQAISEILKPRAEQFKTAQYYAENMIAPSGNLRGGLGAAKSLRFVGRAGIVVGAV